MSAISINGQPAVLHNYRCEECDEVFEEFVVVDQESGVPRQPCPKCGASCPHVFLSRRHYASVHSSERTVVWEKREGGKVEYQFPLLDPALPADLKAEGFVARELNSLREIEQVERESGRMNYKAHFDGDRARWVNRVTRRRR